VLRYIVVGVTANGLGLAVFQGLVVLGVWPEASSLISFFPAFLMAYALNRSWSFGSPVGHLKGMTRYATATAACVTLQVGIVSALHRVIGVHPLTAQIVALGIATPVSYLLLKHWVFR
jgi:putative flippase GtrA